MGYEIRIGNAVLVDDEENPNALPRWEIELISLVDAPIFFGDNAQSNWRCPSYSVWDNFCRTVGLEGLFLRRDNSCQKPVEIIRLTPKNLEIVTEALKRYQEKCHLLPGYCDEFDQVAENVKYDGYLARLIWVEWWTRWAIDNCETPALSIY